MSAALALGHWPASFRAVRLNPLPSGAGLSEGRESTVQGGKGTHRATDRLLKAPCNPVNSSALSNSVHFSSHTENTRFTVDSEEAEGSDTKRVRSEEVHSK